jgi:hypothetical protein
MIIPASVGPKLAPSRATPLIKTAERLEGSASMVIGTRKGRMNSQMNPRQTATIHGVIGLCLAHLKRYAEAEPMLLQASAILEASRGANFYQTQLAYTTLRDMYAAMGRSADAAVFGGKIEKVK